ncbi:four helix bundle protein [Bacillus sp. JRC01]|nr:four helix bundle protein [Bacillus sp. JRC01]
MKILKKNYPSIKTSPYSKRDAKQFIGYKKAKELEERIIELCKNFPLYKTKQIVSQIVRSSNSIKESIKIGGASLYTREV